MFGIVDQIRTYVRIAFLHDFSLCFYGYGYRLAEAITIKIMPCSVGQKLHQQKESRKHGCKKLIANNKCSLPRRLLPRCLLPLPYLIFQHVFVSYLV